MLLNGPRKKLFLIGNPGVGKTTLIEFLYNFLKTKGFPLTGFITKELRDQKERKGFVLVDLVSDKISVLALKKHPYNKTNLPTVGKYQVNIKNLEELIKKYYVFLNNPSYIFIIDEIGKMEVLSSKFCKFIEQLLVLPNCVIATVGKGEVPFLKKVRDFEKSLLCEVTLENRDFLKKRLELEFFRPGKLIVFEGIDGAGKTTVSKYLAQQLRKKGWKVTWSCEPTQKSPYSEILKDKLKNKLRNSEELKDLFLEDRKWHVKNLIIPELEKGQVVILDRYYLSTIAYQGAQGLPLKKLLIENETYSPLPDLVFYLDLPVELGLKRVHLRDEKITMFERKEFLEKVKSLYEKILPLFNFITIKADKSFEQVLEEIVNILDYKLKSTFS